LGLNDRPVYRKGQIAGWWAGVKTIEESQLKTIAVRRRVSDEVVHELIKRVFHMAGAINRPHLTAIRSIGPPVNLGLPQKLWLTIRSSLKLTRLAFLRGSLAGRPKKLKAIQ
jgi:hypothetical protein